MSIALKSRYTRVALLLKNMSTLTRSGNVPSLHFSTTCFLAVAPSSPSRLSLVLITRAEDAVCLSLPYKPRARNDGCSGRRVPLVLTHWSSGGGDKHCSSRIKRTKTGRTPPDWRIFFNRGRLDKRMNTNPLLKTCSGILFLS